MKKSIYTSPIGQILLESDETCITGLNFIDGNNGIVPETEANDILILAKKELDEYFKGERRDFTVTLKYNVSHFRAKCYEELKKIPFGETISYKELAVRIGNPKAVRAVGGANHNNNISVFIPCHRVIGADNKLTGYGGGIWRKEWLIEHERKYKF